MAVCFVAAVVADIDVLQQERFALFKCGLSPVDWSKMTRWQRHDLLFRHRMDAKAHADRVKKDGLGGALAAVLARVLGV